MQHIEHVAQARLIQSRKVNPTNFFIILRRS